MRLVSGMTNLSDMRENERWRMQEDNSVRFNGCRHALVNRRKLIVCSVVFFSKLSSVQLLLCLLLAGSYVLGGEECIF